MTWISIDKNTGLEVARFSRIASIDKQNYGYAHIDDLPAYDGWRALAFDEAGKATSFEPFERPGTVEDVRDEAERRIGEGFLLPDGSRFRCDTTSISRLTGIVAAFEDAASEEEPAPTVVFRTAAGVEMTITSLSEAKGLRRKATGHVATILAASAALQAMDPIPADYVDEGYWS